MLLGIWVNIVNCVVRNCKMTIVVRWWVDVEISIVVHTMNHYAGHLLKQSCVASVIAEIFS